MTDSSVKDERWIVIPKWDEFQHYKDRSPSWIKNYTRLLSDDAYLSLTYAQRGLLHGIWLLTASSNEAPTSTRTRHLLTTNKAEARHFQDNLDALNHAGFIALVSIKPPARVYQKSMPEKRESKNPLPPTGKQAKPEAPEPPKPELFRCQHGCSLDFKSVRRRAEHHSVIHRVEEDNA